MITNKHTFNKLNLTDEILDVLGFSPYCDEHCTWGIRSLGFSNGTRLTVADYEEMFDDTEGNWFDGTYIAKHFSYFATKSIIEVNKDIEYWGDTFFLHELYEIVKFYYPSSLEEFKTNCFQNNMKLYIEQWESYLAKT